MSFIYKTVVPETVKPTPTKLVTKQGFGTGAGRKKGVRNKKNREIALMEEVMKQRILGKLHPLLNAQFALAQGITHVFRIDEIKEGRTVRKEHVLVTDPYEIKDFLDKHEGTNGNVNGTYYYITTKPPDNGAINSMIDRVFGRAKQNVSLPEGGGGGSYQIMLINYDATNSNPVQLPTEAIPVTVSPSSGQRLQTVDSSLAS